MILQILHLGLIRQCFYTQNFYSIHIHVHVHVHVHVHKYEGVAVHN